MSDDSYDTAQYLKQGEMDKREYKTMNDPVKMDTGDDSVYEESDGLIVNNSVMESVANMARALKAAKEEVEEVEEDLTAAKERLRKLEQETIPQYYKTLGITSIVLDTGEVLSVDEVLTCSQVKDEDRLKQAYRWLDAHDGAYLIKKKLEVEELNAAFTDNLKSLGYVEGKDFMVKESVNTASLKSYLSEKLGRKSAIATVSVGEVPKEFGLYIYNKVTIKEAKK